MPLNRLKGSCARLCASTLTLSSQKYLYVPYILMRFRPSGIGHSFADPDDLAIANGRQTV